MGLLRKFFNQTRKPEGFLGKIMLLGMNSGHAKMSDWGMSFLKIDSPKNILDIGCGGGRNAGELLKKYSSAKVTAIDYSPLSVSKAKNYNREMISAGRCNILEENVRAMKFDAGNFDLVTAFETIYFWPGLVECFSEVKRVLRDDGTFLIVNEMDGHDETGKKFEKIIDGMKDYNTEEISDALKAAGFSEVKSEHHASKSWIAVTAKK